MAKSASPTEQKNWARRMVARALQKGGLTRQPCARCGVSFTQAHHSDYSKPLEVTWLCRVHHGSAHSDTMELAKDLIEEIEVFVGPYGALTKSGYRVALLRLFRAAGVRTAKQALAIDDDAAQVILDKLAMQYRQGTVQLTKVGAKGFYKNRKPVNPFRDVVGGKISEMPDWNVLQPGEAETLYNGVKSPRDKAILIALSRQGWRVSELCSLKWRAFSTDHVGDVVVSFVGKGNKPARQGVQPEVVAAAKSWAQGRTKDDDQFIAKDRRGGRLTRFDVTAVLKRCSQKLGRRITPHGLRATYISDVIQRKGIEAARQLARHRSITTTQRYSRWEIIKDDGK